jgi:hypothetical protein
VDRAANQQTGSDHERQGDGNLGCDKEGSVVLQVEKLERLGFLSRSIAKDGDLTFVALVPGSVTIAAANLNRFVFCLGTLLSRQRSATSGANRSYRTQLMIASEFRLQVSTASTVNALRFGPDDAKYFCSSSNEITRSLVRSPGNACTTGDLGMTCHSNASRRRRRKVRKSPLIALTVTPSFRLPANQETISGLIFEICAFASSGKLRRRETAPA